jgi:hypothetical protein
MARHEPVEWLPGQDSPIESIGASSPAWRFSPEGLFLLSGPTFYLLFSSGGVESGREALDIERSAIPATVDKD